MLFEAMVLLLPIWALIKSRFRGHLHKTADRFLSVLFAVSFLTIFILYLLYFGNSGFDGLKDIVLLSFANYTMLVIIVQFLLYGLPNVQARCCLT